MKCLLHIIGFVSLLLFSASCLRRIDCDASIISETRNPGACHSIENSISADVRIIRDNSSNVVVKGPQELVSIITTTVNDSVLKIGYKKGYRIGCSEKAILEVHMPSVSSLRVNGSGYISTSDSLITQKLTLEISGSGDIVTGPVQLQDLNMTISGSGAITVYSGTTSRLNTTVSGSGDIECRNLVSRYSIVDVSGSGNEHLQVTDQLKVTISGSGNVYYRGNPALDVSISGSGKVIHEYYLYDIQLHRNDVLPELSLVICS